MTLPGHPDESICKGRIVCLEFENCYIVGTYVVNAGTNLKVGDQAFSTRHSHWLLDTGCQEVVEHPLRNLHPRTRQEETCCVDWRPKRSSYRERSYELKIELEQDCWLYGSRNQLFQTDFESTNHE